MQIINDVTSGSVPAAGPDLSAVWDGAGMTSAMTFLRERITLRQLRLLRVLDEARNASVAAQRLCISQSAVSKARAEIEDTIGVPIFVRRGHQMEPTPFGQRLVQTARTILGELEATSEDFVMMQGGLYGTVTIGMRSISAQPFVARAAVAFKALYPHVTIKLLDQPVPELLDRLRKGDISFLFASLNQPELDPHLERVQLMADSTVVIANPKHPLAQEKHLEWPQLLAQPWCLMAAGTPPRSYLDAMIAQQRLPYPVDLIEVNSFLMIVTILQDSNYLSLVRQGTARQLMRKSLVRVLHAPVLGARDPVGLVWQRDAPMSPSARLLHRFILDKLENDANNKANAAPTPSAIVAACR